MPQLTDTAQSADRAQELAAVIRAHGHQAAVDHGQLVALARFTYPHPVSGETMAGAVWEPIDATGSAVRAWLGY